MPALPEPVTQLAVVVDLSVLDDVDRAVLVGDGLVPESEVDDGEPSDAERPESRPPLWDGRAGERAAAAIERLLAVAETAATPD